MRNKLILSFLGVILWILAVNFLSRLFLDEMWKFQALSIAGGLFVGMIFGISISSAITKNLSRLVKATNIVSNGDLTHEIYIQSNDEIEELSSAFQKMVFNLQQLALYVKKGAAKVISSSKSLYNSINQMSDINRQVTPAVKNVVAAAETQSNLIAKKSLTLKNMSDSVGRIAEMAKKADTFATQAVKNGRNGKESVQAVIKEIEFVFSQVEKSIASIQALGNKTGKINRVLEIISDIARKTDLLSLNATVEASKAGEYGKGFGIVAEEIRYLTDESKSSAKEIALIIEEIQSENEVVKSSIEKGTGGIKNGREIITTISENLDQIVEEVTRLGENFKEISSETQQQAVGSELMVQSFRELAELAEENSRIMHKSLSAMERQNDIFNQVQSFGKILVNTAEDLDKAVARFKVSDE